MGSVDRVGVTTGENELSLCRRLNTSLGETKKAENTENDTGVGITLRGQLFSLNTYVVGKTVLFWLAVDSLAEPDMLICVSNLFTCKMGYYLIPPSLGCYKIFSMFL